jgi:hypothetical protein
MSYNSKSYCHLDREIFQIFGVYIIENSCGGKQVKEKSN